MLWITLLGLFPTRFAQAQEVVWTQTLMVGTNFSGDEIIMVDVAGDGHGGLVVGYTRWLNPDIHFSWFGATGEVVGTFVYQKIYDTLTRVAIIEADRKRVAVQIMEIPFSNAIWSLTKRKGETRFKARYLRSPTRERRAVSDRLRDRTGYFVLTPILSFGHQVGITITRYAGSPPD